jgi:hypothetical protein
MARRMCCPGDDDDVADEVIEGGAAVEMIDDCVAKT